MLFTQLLYTIKQNKRSRWKKHPRIYEMQTLFKGCQIYVFMQPRDCFTIIGFTLVLLLFFIVY